MASVWIATCWHLQVKTQPSKGLPWCCFRLSMWTSLSNLPAECWMSYMTSENPPGHHLGTILMLTKLFGTCRFVILPDEITNFVKISWSAQLVYWTVAYTQYCMTSWSGRVYTTWLWPYLQSHVPGQNVTLSAPHIEVQSLITRHRMLCLLLWQCKWFCPLGK